MSPPLAFTCAEDTLDLTGLSFCFCPGSLLTDNGAEVALLLLLSSFLILSETELWLLKFSRDLPPSFSWPCRCLAAAVLANCLEYLRCQANRREASLLMLSIQKFCNCVSIERVMTARPVNLTHTRDIFLHRTYNLQLAVYVASTCN